MARHDMYDSRLQQFLYWLSKKLEKLADKMIKWE